MQKTIFALATGNQIAALSVIRVSGEESERILKKLTLKNTPTERLLTLRNFLTGLIRDLEPIIPSVI